MGYIDQEATYDCMVRSFSGIFFAYAAQKESVGGPLQYDSFEPQTELDFFYHSVPLTYIPPEPGDPDYTGPFPVLLPPYLPPHLRPVNEPEPQATFASTQPPNISKSEEKNHAGPHTWQQAGQH